MRIYESASPVRGVVMWLIAALIGSSSADAQQDSARFVPQSGHRLNVLTADISPDGQTLATGSADESIKLWDIVSGMEIRSLPFSAGPVGKVRFSHSGKYVAVGSNSNGAVQIWDIYSGMLLASVVLRAQYITDIEWAPSDSQMAIGLSDYQRLGNSLALLSVDKSPKVITVNTSGDTDSLRYSPDGRWLAVGISSSKAVTLVQATNGATTQDVSLPKRCMNKSSDVNWGGKIAWYGGSTRIAVACGSSLHILDTRSGNDLSNLSTATPVRDIMSAGTGGCVLAFSTGFEIVDSEHYSQNLPELRFLNSSSNQRYLLFSTLNGGSVVVVDPRISGTVTREVIVRRLMLEGVGNLMKYGSIATSPNNPVFATGGIDQQIDIWSGFPFGPLRRHTKISLGERINSLTFDSLGERLLYGAKSEVGVVRLGEDRPSQVLSLNTTIGVEGLAADRVGGGSVAALTRGELLMLTGDPLQVVEQAAAPTIRDNSSGVGLAWLSNSTIVTATDTNLIYWRGMRDKQYMNIDTSIDSAAAGESGHFYLGGGMSKFVVPPGWGIKTVESFDLRTGSTVIKDTRNMIYSMEIDAEGPRVALALQQPSRVRALAVSRSKQLLASGSEDGKVRLFKLSDLSPAAVLEDGVGDVTDLGFLAGGDQLLSYGLDGWTRIWNTENSHLIAMVFSQGDQWIVATPQGLFDTNEIEESRTAGWVFPDEPLRVWPLTILMRQYYEPLLLSKVFNTKRLRSVPNLLEVNRIQPDVRIVDVRRGASAEEALMEVEVGGKEDPSQKNRKTKTAAYDLRLFRDGQLVGQWPEPRSGMSGAADIGAWRNDSRVPGADEKTKARHLFKVKLASRDRGQTVTFTAYAFNEDRVKSATATRPYEMPADIAPRTPRAYIVTVGVNAYQNPGRNLQYAVSDAEALAAALKHVKDYEPVSVSLLSKSPAADQATKANIRAVLGLLAGKGEAEPDRLKQAGVEVDRLAKVTPDDLVVLAFSGHGHTEPDGRFFILPSDSGAGDTITPADLPGLISSEELSAWLREVDAGEMVMILDACHAAEVTTTGEGEFKPGPMGDRGLGQLAYDKGMRILAATQAADVALEIDKLHHGLLTYALVEEGLDQRKADPDGRGTITLAEWLQYGEKRVPTLYEDLHTGKYVPTIRGEIITAKELRETVTQVQTPELFDFHKGKDNVILGVD